MFLYVSRRISELLPLRCCCRGRWFGRESIRRRSIISDYELQRHHVCTFPSVHRYFYVSAFAFNDRRFHASRARFSSGLRRRVREITFLSAAVKRTASRVVVRAGCENVPDTHTPYRTISARRFFLIFVPGGNIYLLRSRI